MDEVRTADRSDGEGAASPAPIPTAQTRAASGRTAPPSRSARVLARLGVDLDSPKSASNMVYGALLTGAYFVGVIDQDDALPAFIEKGAVGFGIMAICHGFANYVTTDIGTAFRHRIARFWANEIFLLVPFLLVVVTTLIGQRLLPAADALEMGYDLSVTIIVILTYAASRVGHRGRVASGLFAVGAGLVGVLVGVLKALL